MNKFSERSNELTTQLFVRFKIIYGAKWTNNFDDDTIALAVAEWSAATVDLSNDALAQIIEHCKITLEWPPSIAEFISIAEKHQGIPSWEDALKAAIRRDFYHILIMEAFNAVGSWAFSRDSEKELGRKFKIAYEEVIRQSRSDRLKAIEHEGVR